MIKPSVEATLGTLLSTLKIIASVEIKFWKTPSRITSQNLRSFQGKCPWWSSVLAKALSLRFTVMLFMILKLMILWNYIQVHSEPSRTSMMEHLGKISNSCKQKALFLQKAPSWMFDWILNTPLLYYDFMNSNLWLWAPLDLNCSHTKHSYKQEFFMFLINIIIKYYFLWLNDFNFVIPGKTKINFRTKRSNRCIKLD